VWGLNLILTPSDDIFAEKVAGTTPEDYRQFKSAVLAKLKARESFNTKQQHLLEEMKKDINAANAADEAALDQWAPPPSSPPPTPPQAM
jgi:hypothetical protein